MTPLQSRLLTMLQNYMKTYPAFRTKPMGAPWSVAQIEQQFRIALEDEARRLVEECTPRENASATAAIIKAVYDAARTKARE